jgi:hypothetical protein
MASDACGRAAWLTDASGLVVHPDSSIKPVSQKERRFIHALRRGIAPFTETGAAGPGCRGAEKSARVDLSLSRR